MFSNVKKYNINHIHNRTKCGIHSSTTFNWKGGMNEENQWKIGKKMYFYDIFKNKCIFDLGI